MILLWAFLLGVVSGCRSMLGPAAVCWGAYLGWLAVRGTPLSFLSSAISVGVFTLLAAGELVADKLPFIPSRKDIGPFGARLVSGGLVGAAVGVGQHSLWLGVVSGVIGAAVGTLAGHWARARLAIAFGRDWPAAVLEDGVVIAVAVVSLLGAAGMLGAR